MNNLKNNMMKKRNTLIIALIGAIVSLNSCINNIDGMQKREGDTHVSDNVAAVLSEDMDEEPDTMSIDSVDSYMSVYKKDLGNGHYRDFYIVRDDWSYKFRIYDSKKDRRYNSDFYGDDYLNEGVPGMYGFASPDGKYVYVVGDILANSTGWICTFIIYQINTQTLKTILVNGVAAVKLVDDGFCVASMTRCTTPEATCSAGMDFAFEDITYGFDGRIKHKSKEYPSSEIEKRYGEALCNVKGLGIRRGTHNW
ncbi:MAG: hypothetical protein IJ604_02410 [Prevotella sp.]|nr:hypothetical protein [Prevotella sp.]